MPRLALLLLTLLCGAGVLAQPEPYASRGQALTGLAHADAGRRALAVAWLADHGTPADAALLRQRLTDVHPAVRGSAEQGLWQLWSRSGDRQVDALMAEGGEQMQARQFKASIATFTEVIRRKPGFAEGWNRRATVLYLAGEYQRSLADCDQVIRRNPHHFGALAGYGQIYFQLEEYEKAIRYWKRALGVNPNMAGVEINIQGAELLLAEKRRRST